MSFDVLETVLESVVRGSLLKPPSLTDCSREHQTRAL
jgi:hypothetical protein